MTDRSKLQAIYNDLLELQDQTDHVPLTVALDAVGAALNATRAQTVREPALVGLLTEVDPGLADALRENGGYVQAIRGNVLREATQLAIGAVSKVVSSRDDLGNVHFVLLSDAIITSLTLPSTQSEAGK